MAIFQEINKNRHMIKTLYHSLPFGFIICRRTGTVIRFMHGKEGNALGEYKDRRFQSLFTELSDYERKGVSMQINGLPASPMQIVQAHIMREESSYMRDYVLNDKGDLKELGFNDVKTDKAKK